MPKDNGITSAFSAIALVSLIISCIMYLFAVISAVRRLKASKRKKNSGIGVLSVILGTLFAVIAFQLYIGFSIWFLLGVVVVDSVLVLLLTD